MTIYNPKSFTDQLWDWGVLDGCFGNSMIKPTDVDGLVEHNGHFLMLEAKNSGVPMPQGQAILHRAWLSEGKSLIVIYGPPGAPERIECYMFGKQKPWVNDSADIEWLRKAVAWWYEQAHNHRKN